MNSSTNILDFFISNQNGFVLLLLQYNFTKTNKRKGGKGGKLYTYSHAFEL